MTDESPGDAEFKRWFAQQDPFGKSEGGAADRVGGADTAGKGRAAAALSFVVIELRARTPVRGYEWEFWPLPVS
jgi:hypothetical protein